jgi:hypothetical protein
MNITRNNKKINNNDKEWGNIESQPPIISFGQEIGTMFDHCCLGPIKQLLVNNLFQHD